MNTETQGLAMPMAEPETIKIQENAPHWRGQVTAVAFRIPPGPAYDEYRTMDGAEFMRRFRAGELPREMIKGPAFKRKNSILEHMEDSFIERLLGTWTGGGSLDSDKSLHVKRLAIGTSSADPDDLSGGEVTPAPKGSDQLAREIYRAAPTERLKGTGKKAIFTLYVGPTTANPAGSDPAARDITVASGSHTTTSLTVNDATDINVGDAIFVNLAVPLGYGVVIAKSGNVLTLDPAKPLPAIPVSGQWVQVCWAEIAILGNEGAGDTPNSGDPLARVILDPPFPKDTETPIGIEYQIIAAGT